MRVVVLRTGDKYGLEYATRLYTGLARNTTVPFEYEVITETKYPGWWGKIELFNPKERLVVLDLDIVITGNVDFLFEYDGPFCAWKDPWSSGLNGSIHSIAPGYGKELRAVFEAMPKQIMREFYSDQEFLRTQTKPDYWPDGLIQSYKAQSLEQSPKAARIVVFHGNPKPHECGGWVKEMWS
jgi:hypothetical protein